MYRIGVYPEKKIHTGAGGNFRQRVMFVLVIGSISGQDKII